MTFRVACCVGYHEAPGMLTGDRLRPFAARSTVAVALNTVAIVIDRQMIEIVCTAAYAQYLEAASTAITMEGRQAVATSG